MQTRGRNLLPFDPTSKQARQDSGDVPSWTRHVIESTSREDYALIMRLLERAIVVSAQRKVLIPSTMKLGLDIAIAHARRPLHLGRLAISSDQDIYDEVVGISQHVDRTNGYMRDGWESRYWVDRSAQA